MQEESFRVRAGRKGGEVWAKKAKTLKEKRIQEYNSNPKLCKQCQEPIPYHKQRYQKYCSRSCSATANNQGICRVRRNNSKNNPIPCQMCGQMTKNKTFCTQQCGADYSRKKTWEAIETGTWKDSTGRNNKTIRIYLLANRGHQCECCNLEEWEGEPIPLTIHHIDGDATNNLLENVELRCWNCHALTDNFGRRNQKSTRSYRYA